MPHVGLNSMADNPKQVFALVRLTRLDCNSGAFLPRTCGPTAPIKVIVTGLELTLDTAKNELLLRLDMAEQSASSASNANDVTTEASC